MKTNTYVLLVQLVAFLVTSVMTSQTSYGVDIPLASENPYVTLAGTQNAMTTTNGLTFELTGSTALGTRTRTGVTATPVSVLEDFVFIVDGTSTIMLTITGFTEGQEYTINSYHLEGNPLFPARMSVELQENGVTIAGGAQIIDNDSRVTSGIYDQTTTEFIFSAVAGATYSIISTALTNTLSDPPGGTG